MWQLTLLANSGDDKPSANEIVYKRGGLCPKYLLPTGDAGLINQNLASNLKVSLVLLDKYSQERYEGEIDRILSAIDEQHKQRWNIIGKGIHQVQFKDEKDLSYTGVGFRPVRQNQCSICSMIR